MRREPIAMITHSYYEEDPRVRREAEALVAAGHPVDVFALRRRGTAARDEIAGVHVERLDVQRHQGAGIPTYLAEYAAFFARAALALARAHRRRRYGLVQVHSLPDPLVFAALPLRLAGVPVLLDLHEAMPEFFRTRFPGAANPVVHGLLLVAERASIAAADAVVTVNEALAERLVGRGVDPATVAIVRNAPALARFDPAAHPTRSFAEDGLLRLVYAGALSPVYELDCALEAVARLRPALAERGLGLRFDVYGRDYGEVPLGGAGGRARPRRARRLPRPDPHRGRPGGDRRRRHRPRPDPPDRLHRLQPLDEALRVRGHGQARRRLGPTDGRADLPAGHGRPLRAR
ncbi:MAG: hypothetical protein KatS3mg065_0918 [Chloroflexota bacterium]|nr:MAG: hypothetical protein KatS3mg065_0918 [Chloroflexota bacterium]